MLRVAWVTFDTRLHGLQFLSTFVDHWSSKCIGTNLSLQCDCRMYCVYPWATDCGLCCMWSCWGWSQDVRCSEEGIRSFSSYSLSRMLAKSHRLQSWRTSSSNIHVNGLLFFFFETLRVICPIPIRKHGHS